MKIRPLYHIFQLIACVERVGGLQVKEPKEKNETKTKLSPSVSLRHLNTLGLLKYCMAIDLIVKNLNLKTKSVHYFHLIYISIN